MVNPEDWVGPECENFRDAQEEHFNTIDFRRVLVEAGVECVGHFSTAASRALMKNSLEEVRPETFLLLKSLPIGAAEKAERAAERSMFGEDLEGSAE